MTELKKYKLGEVVDITTGKLDANAANSNGIYPYFTCGESPSRINSYAFDADAILIAGNNAQGNFHINRYNGKFNAYQRTYVVTAKDGFDIDFIFYSLKLALQHFKKQSLGSQTKFLTMPILGNFTIEIPSNQQRIASVLSNLDSKISLNRKMNRTLEAMAKQLYDYWFVQFDFPNEDGNPYKSSGGNMVWNEVLKREIPEGWEVKSLGELLSKLSSGKRPKGGIDKTLNEGIPSLGAECIDELGVFDFSSTPYLPLSYKDSIRSGIIEDKDILIYKDGAYVGKTTLFQDGFPFGFACVNEHVFLIHAKNEDLQEFLLFTLKTPTYYEMMQKYGKAKAAQPGLNQDDICSIPILLPAKEILKQYRQRIEAPFHLIFSQSLEIADLTRQRDELLPLLMNGQVTVE